MDTQKGQSQMSFRMLISSFAATGIFAGFVQATPMYSVVDLGTLGGTTSYAYAINNHGQVVGHADSSVYGQFRATLFSGTGTANVDLSTPGRLGASYASDINDSGQAVGFDLGVMRAILFSGTGLGNVDLGASRVATGINDRGQTVGYLYPPARAILFSGYGWDSTDLGTLGGRHSQAAAINQHGQVVGFARNLDGIDRATLFSGMGDYNIDLGTLGGRHSGANDINDHGQVVGHASLSSGYWHATLFSGTGLGNTDLGALGGPELYSQANGINNNGWIVGESQNGERNDSLETGLEEEAFLWRPGIGMVNLEDLISPTAGWDFDSAVGINDFGQIAANGCRSGVCRALRLDPFTSSVPEPGSLALLSLGLLGIGVLRPKKR